MNPLISIAREMQKGRYIQTFTGELIALRFPQPHNILLEDIAHSLARLCRYTGHCTEFYSVAQHSVWMCRQARDRGFTPGQQKQALLHDATEAYLGDVASPLKALLPEYKYLEELWWGVISSRFGMAPFLSPLVKALDLEALRTEAEHLLVNGPQGPGWGFDAQEHLHLEPLGRPLDPIDAEQKFWAEVRRLEIV